MSVLQKIRSNFFDVSPDGTLVYTDPSIGPLHSPRRKLTVRMNESKSCLELTLNGQVCEDFNLNLGAVKACKDAFGAYFKMIEDLRMDAEAEAAVA